VRSATTLIDQMVQTTSGAAQLSQLFNTCEQVNPNDWQQLATFSSSLMGNFMTEVQYSRFANAPGSASVATMCAMMENTTTTPLENYAAVSNWFLAMQNSSCLDISYKNQVTSISNLTDFSGGRSWTYQTCTQVGYFQSTDSPTQPFGSLVPLVYYTKLCTDAFGLNMTNLPRVAEVNSELGSTKITGATRIYFINCSLDPWASLSIVQSLSPSLLALVVRDGSHCCAMRKHPNNPLVTQAQKKIEHQIGVWLNAGPL